MGVTLTLRRQPPARVDAAWLTPAAVRERSAGQIEASALACGREQLALGDLFDVEESAAGDELALCGDLRAFDRIGAAMTGGRLTVDGDCGDRVGAGMRDGELRVSGSVGAWAGEAMHGGLLSIAGDAGPRLGAAAVGARAGMTGGEIVVAGSAGEEAGAGMRRGLVAVGGRVADGAGLRMLAGTVVALAGLGADAGIGNRRGTLVSGAPLAPPPGRYAFAARYRPPALALQLRRLRALGLPIGDALIDGRWARWSGDRTELSRGEILIYETEES